MLIALDTIVPISRSLFVIASPFEGYEYDEDHWKADFNKAVNVYTMISAQIMCGIPKRITSGEGVTEEEQWTNSRVIDDLQYSQLCRPLGHTQTTIVYFKYVPSAFNQVSLHAMNKLCW